MSNPPCFPVVGTDGKGSWIARCTRHDWKATYGSQEHARRGAAAHKRSWRRKRVAP